MFLIFSLSVARAASSWLEGVDETVDRALPQLNACVQFSHAVDADGSQIVVLQVEADGEGKTRVRPVDQSMVESWITRCMADTLSKVDWPEAAAPIAAITTLRIEGIVPRRALPSFLAAEYEDSVGGPRALNKDWIGLVFRRKVDLGRRCLHSLVVTQSDHTSGRLVVRYRVGEGGGLERESVRGPEELGEVRECVLKELDKVRLPEGYPDTRPLVITVEFAGEGGEWARSDATTLHGARAYSWSYRYWVSLDRDPNAPPETPIDDPLQWFYAYEVGFDSAVANLRGCALRAGVRRADVDLLVIAGAEGVTGVAAKARTGSRELAECFAQVAADVAIRPATSRLVGAARVELYSSESVVLHAPAPAATGEVWSADAIAAANAGDGAALAAALPTAVLVLAAETPAALPPAAFPPGTWSWTLGVPGRTWSGLVVTEGDPAVAERDLGVLRADLGVCSVLPQPGKSPQLVVRLHADDEAHLHLDRAYSNPFGEDTLACVRTALEGRSVSPGGGAFTAYWPIALAGH